MPFQPGQSGNPGGVAKADRAVKELARQHTDKAIAALVAALDDPKTRVAAATALLDRGYGRPVQAIAGADGESPVDLNLTVRFIRPGDAG
jgi:hypothetical protein